MCNVNTAVLAQSQGKHTQRKSAQDILCSEDKRNDFNLMTRS